MTASSKWSAKGPMILGIVTLTLLVGGLGGWSVFTTIQGAVVAPGQIQVEQNRQVVQHPDGGVVAEIAVTEGQTVAAGDLLLRLDGAAVRSELAIVESQLYERMARRARLEAEQSGAAAPVIPEDLVQAAQENPDVAGQVQGQIALFDARLDAQSRQIEQLERRISQLAEQNDALSVQEGALNRQLDLIRKELGDQKALLAKGLTQETRVLALEREEARILGDAGQLGAARAQNAGTATQVQIEILRLQSQRRAEAAAELRDIGSQELELAERRRALHERVERLEIRAPVAGVVFGLQVTTPKAVLRPADPILFLIPQDRPLVIAAQIAPIHIDEVHVGQKVHLMFPAFQSRTLPEIFGHVTLVSPDALADQNSGTTFYRAEIILDEGEMAKLEGRILVPGMPVEAFIQTADRTPLAYLLKPLTDYFLHAFRET